MSELYNVSTPLIISLREREREGESHLLHLVTEQWLPLQSLFLLHNLINPVPSNVRPT